MIKPTHILFLIAFVIAACNSEKIKPYSDKCFSPVMLKPDTTRVRLASYTSDWKDIISVQFNNKDISIDSTGHVQLTDATEPISVLFIKGKEFQFELPVFKSEKIKYHFEYKNALPNALKVELAGSMNGWNRKATPLQKINGVWQTDLILNRGQYAYRIWEDDKEKMDEGNPVRIDNGLGGENNAFEAGEKLSDAPQLITHRCNEGSIEITGKRVSKIYAFWMNRLIDVKSEGEKVNISIPAAAAKLEHSEITVFAHDGMQRSNELIIPLQHGKVIHDAALLPRTDMHGAVMYFAMIDRFHDGEAANNFPVQDPSVLPKANNMGGDLQGITAKIKDGYFEKLGINTLWLSPVTANAEGAWGLWDKGVTSKFSGYHGYWPISLRSIDRRLGNEEAMRDLITEAHARGMNVILDYVAHHVHQEHPLYQQHPEWTTPLYLPDGTMNTEKWDEHRLTTWFDTFLPTWKFADHNVVDALTDTAMYWVESFDLDGFRHDATKHVEIDFWQTLTQKIEKYRSHHLERKIYQIGETYGNPELISSYIGTGSMDAQFDFNLYDAAVDAFAKKETNFKNLT
ncbi:MAG: alpha-amylase family glycosyl hydrolase, partial [Flavobacteriales bacterium]